MLSARLGRRPRPAAVALDLNWRHLISACGDRLSLANPQTRASAYSSQMFGNEDSGGEGGGSSGACLLAFSNFPSAAVEGFQLSSLTTFWGLMADFMSCPPSCLLILELPVLWRREPRFNIFEDLNPPVFSVGIAFGTWLLLPCV